MSKLVIIGIDGMDWPLLEPMLPELPALSGICSRGYAGEMLSVFPPDSIPSWVSIFTGQDPSEHGVLASIDYFKKDVKQFSIDTSAFKGRTFWDLAGTIGKKVIVINPLLAYPPWKVEGVMASGPVFVSGETRIYPDEIGDRIGLPPLGGIVDFPEKSELASFAENTRKETGVIVDFTAKIMKSRPWDLVFISLLTLDRVMHFFWRYYDKNDPTHPRSNEHANVIRDFHGFLDACVAEIAAAAGEDTMIMIISDHGHGRRPPLLFNLNQLLLENGLLESRISGPKIMSPRYMVERAKNFTLETLHRLDMEDLAYRFAHIFPWTRKLKKREFLTEPSSNIATASEFGGTNPFGGIEISKERCSEKGLDYEELRDSIIRLLLDTKDDKNQRVFIWAKRREEIYNGRFIDKFPDILYEMEPSYGTNWSLHLPLITVNPRHRKISGGHRKNGVLIAGPLDGWQVKRDLVSPINIVPTVLTVLTDGTVDLENSDLRNKVKGSSFIEK